jgi:hypothetical protein
VGIGDCRVIRVYRVVSPEPMEVPQQAKITKRKAPPTGIRERGLIL